MANNRRRDFLIRTGRAGLAVSIGVPLLGACFGEDVDEPTGVYDVIIVGGGAAGLVVATKLQRASNANKRILLLEAGGPTTAAIGGKAFPPWAPAARNDLTMFDVPGSYSQLAWTAFGLELLLYAKADRIDFDATGTATAVQYTKREGIDQTQPGAAGTARLRSAGPPIIGVAPPR